MVDTQYFTPDEQIVAKSLPTKFILGIIERNVKSQDVIQTNLGLSWVLACGKFQAGRPTQTPLGFNHFESAFGGQASLVSTYTDIFTLATYGNIGQVSSRNERWPPKKLDTMTWDMDDTEI